MGRSRRLPDGKRAVRAWSRGSRAARPAQTRALPVTCGLRIRDQAPWLPQGTGPARTRAGPPQQGLAQGWPPLRTPSGTSVVISGGAPGTGRAGPSVLLSPPTPVPRTPRREGPGVSRAAGTLLHRSLAPRVTRDSCLFCTSPPRGLTQALVNGPRSFGPCGLSSQLSV